MEKNPTLIPSWFVEGVATFIGENEVELDYQSFKPNFIKSEKLKTDQQWEKALEVEGTHPYFQCYFSIAFLINKYCDNVIFKLLGETSVSKKFQQSLQKVTGKNIEELEMDIISYYEK